jgi:hypothetical protein
MKTTITLSFLLLIITLALKAQPTTELIGNYPVGKENYGDSILVTHSQGIGEGNVYVVVENPSQLTNDPYEVFFNQQTYYRNENGEWIPIGKGKNHGGSDGSDTLTGSTIDIGAIYGPSAGIIEFRCHLNLVNPDYNFADGITMAFPSGVAIISAPPFEAGNGWVYPEIVGSTVNMGIVNGPPTGNGVFVGGEEWTIYTSSFTPPITIDWIIYDDGFSGGIVNAEGSTEIDSIGYAYKTQNEWNLKNLGTQDTVLKRQTVIMGYDIYTGQYVGDPSVEGFKISVDVVYDPPIEFSDIKLYSPTGLTILTSNSNTSTLDIQNYTIFGVPTSWAIDGFGVGTNELDELVQDYELRFTGIYDTTEINGQTVYFVSTGGQMATVFRMIDAGSLANHPLNPNPGVAEPFLLRIPFEVWNVGDPENPFQINLTFRDRQRNGTENPFWAWNPTNRMYAIIVNSPYDPNQVIQITNGPDPYNASATWITVHYGTNYHLDDVVTIVYRRPVEFGIDKFTFSTPPAGVNGEELFPKSFKIFQNYPNPFNPVTTIKYSIPEISKVSLTLFNVLGEAVVTLVNEEKTMGNYTVDFNASNLPSGVYFYQLKAGNFAESKKMILLK